MHNRSSRSLAAAKVILVLAAALAGLIASEGRALACACGCGVFETGGVCMIPDGQGVRAYVEYDFQNQHENWHGDGLSGSQNNTDKDIRTHYITLGAQWMITPDWGVQAELPFDIRHFVTTGGASGSDIITNNWGSFGDIRVKGIYAGFLEDHSLGVTFGLKLPTGDYTQQDAYNDIDRDSEIGTGSVDVLLGAYYSRKLASSCSVFGQCNLDAPVICRNRYYPGLEFDAAVGMSFPIDVTESVKVSPLGQLINSVRMKDTGRESADPVQSGFERILVSLGFQVDVYAFSLYADVEAPIFAHTIGNQLVAPVLAKVEVSYKF